MLYFSLAFQSAVIFIKSVKRENFNPILIGLFSSNIDWGIPPPNDFDLELIFVLHTYRIHVPSGTPPPSSDRVKIQFFKWLSLPFDLRWFNCH